MTKTDEKYLLKATPRDIFGKQVKKLRRSGAIPANIYGPGFKSKAVTVNVREFGAIYKKAKETGVVYLQVEGSKEEIPTLTKNVQRHPLDNQILHIDFRKIDLSQKIETEVPVIVIGTSEAVAHKGGVLITQNDHLLVEALPTEIPKEIEVDISGLTEVGTDIKVADLPKATNYVIKNEPETVIVSITAHKEESLTPETTPTEAPEVLTAKEGEEGAAEGEAPAEEGEKKPAAAEAPTGKEAKGEKKDDSKKE